ncbi:hypothetical protein [Biformimicrobium ophioploci]|uniref:Uncharacterized protein n=1 Tax=Biformimicrobium ophioploci TaxID=3036711 RepID=A0ABQ6M342_9GAMM|nr:hypothetical protein [Microbulbifer sp. NKW57]GMG88770.1 hypothetical protein MNKW57_30910 [Microbulbifer sp. NKW57]
MSKMNRILISIFILFASSQLHANEEALVSYIYKFPLLICYSDEYRACYGGVEVEQCAKKLRTYRDACIDQMDSVELGAALKSFSGCLIASHAGVGSIEDISDPCLKEKGMNINLTLNIKRIAEADQDWVEKVLE